MRTQRVALINEVLPLAQRLRYLEVFRVAAVGLVVAGAVLWDGVSGTLGPSTVAYAAVAAAGGIAWRLMRRRGLTLFGALIILDGIFLAWVTHATGGTSSPFRYVVILHLVTVTLLASYRTGLKLALWHSLLLLTGYHLEREGILALAGKSVPDVESTAAFMVVFWVAALLTATFAAANERELRRRKVDLEGLAVMAAELETVSEPAAAAAILAANVRSHFALERVAVLRVADRGCVVQALEGSPAPVRRSFQIHRDSVLIDVLRSRSVQLVAELDPEMDAELAELLPGARNVVVLCMSAESAVGVLVAEYGSKKRSKVARRSIEMLERFGSHGVLALRNAELAEEMRRLASTDGLTGAANRRTFDSTLDWELRRAQRSGKPLSLIIADIDHFKRLNDVHGHQAGDDALRDFVSVVRRKIRAGDIVARIGGEEFAIVVPHCDSAEAAKRADAIRKAVASRKKLGLTVSFGVATYPSDAAEASRLVAAADRALYAAKCDGRNAVKVFDPAMKAAARRVKAGQRPRRRRDGDNLESVGA